MPYITAAAAAAAAAAAVQVLLTPQCTLTQHAAPSDETVEPEKASQHPSLVRER